MKNNIFSKIYVITLICLLAVPFVLFFIFPSVNTTENKKLSELPCIATEGKINENYMKDLSQYFEDRFAFRTELVDINSRIRSTLFRMSSNDEVIVGTDGWLYYSATLDDYRGDDISSDRELYCIARNVALMQNYVENKGATFVFTICPNKNSLYPYNMPSHLSYRVSNERDARRLEKYLDEAGVNYVNLYELYEGNPEIQYLKTDSHWNKKGAVLGYNAMLDAAGKAHEDYSDIEYSLVPGKIAGDLSLMIYPVSTKYEDDYEYNRDYTYKYYYCDNVKPQAPLDEVLKTGADAEDVTYSEIITGSDNGDGALLMYRDSFGNALIDLMSEEFETSYFSKLEPYNLSKMNYVGADTVILEKVERHLQSLGKVAPLMPADKINEGDNSEESKAIFENITKSVDFELVPDVYSENGLMLVSGKIDGSMIDTDSRVFALICDNGELSACEAFLINENDFALYVNTDNDALSVKIFVTTADGIKTGCNSEADAVITKCYEDIKEAERLEREREEAEELALKEAEEKAKEAERLKAEEEKRLEEERLRAEEEKRLEEEKLKEQEKAKKSGASAGGKKVVRKTFYEDCGSDSGYYEIVWSDGSVTYEDVY